MSKLYAFAVAGIVYILSGTALSAQHKAGAAEFDALVHDFGDIVAGSGAVSCTFNVKNTGDKPIAILGVNTSCGCTDVEYTREPIRPGAAGKIKVSYSNDEGPYPFDKTVSVFVSGSNKPVILKLKGVCRQKKLSLAESYPLKKGPFGLRNEMINGGYVEQGMQKSDSFKIANLSSKSVTLAFGHVSEGLSVSSPASRVSAGELAEITWTVTADRKRWGLNDYSFDVLADGKKVATIVVKVSTKENFSFLSKAEKEAGPTPMFNSSTFTFNRVKSGTVIDVSYEMKNSGKQPLSIYKVDFNSAGLSCPAIGELQAGSATTLRMKFDTKGLPSGEVLAIITLTTNSPLRPVVNLFVTGWIE